MALVRRLAKGGGDEGLSCGRAHARRVDVAGVAGGALMSKEHNGGSAFPTPAPGYPGMSLRDYLAVKAAAALLVRMQKILKDWPDHYANIAEMSYEFADAMLKEREK